MIVLPIAPPGSSWWRFADKARGGDFNEEIGWPELVQTIASIRDSLPVQERSRLGILAAGSGQAGAINLYGPALGLPKAMDELSLASRVWRSAPRDGDRCRHNARLRTECVRVLSNRWSCQQSLRNRKQHHSQHRHFCMPQAAAALARVLAGLPVLRLIYSLPCPGARARALTRLLPVLCLSVPFRPSSIPRAAPGQVLPQTKPVGLGLLLRLAITNLNLGCSAQ